MEDDQQFCLRWNNHQSTLIQNFDTLLESGTLVDCTLAAEGKYLKAHKVVLSACSPYFEGLLSEHYDKHPVFILKDVKFKELKAMMDYMYRGEVNISQDQLTALLKAAESLQIKGLSDSRTGGSNAAIKDSSSTRPAIKASSTAAASVSAPSVDIPHASSGLTIEKNSKVPRQSLQQVSVSDLPENSASPQLRGHSSREGSQSPSRKRKRLRRRSLGNDDNSMENHEASNSSDVNLSAPALGVAPVAEEKSHADPADSVGRSALMQQLTKPADEMLQTPLEKPEPNEEMIKSEYQDDQESVEDLTNFDDDMNDLNEMEQDNSRAGPSHDPSQHAGMPSWHVAGDRSNASIVGAAAGTGAGDEVFLAAAEAAQAQRDSQVGRKGGRRAVTTRSKLKACCIDKALTSLREKLKETSNGSLINPETNRPIRRVQLKNKITDRSPERKAKRKYNKRKAKAENAAIGPLRKMKLKKRNYNSYEEYHKQPRICPGQKLACLTLGCDRVFKLKSSLLRHLAYECGIVPPFKCGHCSFRSQYIRSIRVHNSKRHADKEPKVLELKNGQFLQVETSYNQQFNLPALRKLIAARFYLGYPMSQPVVSSLQTNRNTYPRYPCPRCGHSYKNHSDMRKHYKFHCGKAPRWGCPYCPKVSKISSNMYVHIRGVHKNQNIYVVDLYKEKSRSGVNADASFANASK